MGASRHIPGSGIPTYPEGEPQGDLSGDYPNPTVAGVQGQTFSSTSPEVGEVLLYDSSWTPVKQWNYPPVHVDGVTGPTAVWQFDRSASHFTDRVGDADAAANLGTDYVSAFLGLRGAFPMNTRYDSAASGKLLSTGAFSIVVPWAMFLEPGNALTERIISSGNGGGGVANQLNWGLSLYDNQTVVQWAQESTAGGMETWESDVAVPLGYPVIIGVTRATNGVDISIYMNGRLCDTNTMAAAPDGGTSGRHRMFADSQSTGLYIQGWCPGMAVWKNTQLSTAEVLLYSRAINPTLPE